MAVESGPCWGDLIWEEHPLILLSSCTTSGRGDVSHPRMQFFMSESSFNPIFDFWFFVPHLKPAHYRADDNWLNTSRHILSEQDNKGGKTRAWRHEHLGQRHKLSPSVERGLWERMAVKSGGKTEEVSVYWKQTTLRGSVWLCVSLGESLGGTGGKQVTW